MHRGSGCLLVYSPLSGTTLSHAAMCLPLRYGTKGLSVRGRPACGCCCWGAAARVAPGPSAAGTPPNAPSQPQRSAGVEEESKAPDAAEPAPAVPAGCCEGLGSEVGCCCCANRGWRPPPPNSRARRPSAGRCCWPAVAVAGGPGAPRGVHACCRCSAGATACGANRLKKSDGSCKPDGSPPSPCRPCCSCAGWGGAAAAAGCCGCGTEEGCWSSSGSTDPATACAWGPGGKRKSLCVWCAQGQWAAQTGAGRVGRHFGERSGEGGLESCQKGGKPREMGTVAAAAEQGTQGGRSAPAASSSPEPLQQPSPPLAPQRRRWVQGLAASPLPLAAEGSPPRAVRPRAGLLRPALWRRLLEVSRE